MLLKNDERPTLAKERSSYKKGRRQCGSPSNGKERVSSTGTAKGGGGKALTENEKESGYVGTRQQSEKKLPAELALGKRERMPRRVVKHKSLN